MNIKRLLAVATALLLINLMPLITKAQWASQTSGTTEALNSVCFYGSDTGYVAGNNGVILKTLNSGTLWTPQSSGTTNYLTSIYLTNANTGYVVGQGGIILKTMNGGVNWNAQISPTTNNLRSVYFVDPNIGYAVGDYLTILKTNDGGTNWTVVNTSVLSTQLYCVKFINSCVGLAVGYNNTIYKTIDGGINWTSLSSGITGGSSWKSIYMADEFNYYVSGQYYTGSLWQDILIRSANGGQTWTVTAYEGSHGIFFLDRNTGYALSNLGATCDKTTNNSSFVNVSTGLTSPLNSLFFANANNGWITGNYGRIFHTVTGGEACAPTPSKPVGPTYRCQSSSTSQYTTLNTNANAYVWSLNPGTAGVIVGNGTTATVTWDIAHSGNATITVEAQYVSCNITSSALTVVTNTTTPVSFGLGIPANGVYTNATPNFTWGSSTGAVYYQLWIDGILKKDNIPTSSYQITSNESISAGMHTWYVVASNGCTTQSSDTWSFLADVNAPTVFNLVSPADNMWTTSTQPTLTWSASSDVNSGLAKYQLWIDGALNRDNISNTSTTTTPTGSLSNGTHIWMIKAIDNVGNIRNSNQIWIIKIDNIPPGFLDNCVSFDGVNDYAISNSSISMENIITIEAWIKITGGNGTERGIMDNDPTYLAVTADNHIKYRYYQGSNLWSGDRLSNTILSNLTWYHIAIVQNATSGSLKIYINGNLDNSFTGNTGDLNTATQFNYGRASRNGYNYFNGYIDEVRVWNIERTLTQIQESYNKIIEGSCVSGLLGYWRNNDNIGSAVIADFSTQNNNCSLMNGAAIIKSDKTNEVLGGLCNLKTPVCSQYIQTNLPSFTWCQAKDLGIGFQKFQLFIDGNMVKDNQSDSSWTITTPLTYGQHSWSVRGFDSLGINQATYSRIFYIDNAQPNAFNLVSPANNSIVSLPTPSFTWQGTADSSGGSGLRKYQLWINGVKNRDSISALSTTTTPTSPLAQGCYTWFMKAIDNVGNVRQSNQTWTFCVDWEPPIPFTLVSPIDNETVNVSRPNFIWHPSGDIGSGLQKYELIISGQSVVTVSPTDTSNTIVFDLPNGSYTWYVKAYDNANAFTSSNVHNMIVDVPLPAKPATPTGPTSLCINSPNTAYSAAGGTYATSYVWNIYPGSAGVISGTGLSADVDWNNSYTGTARITVKGHNPVGDGPSSDTLFIDISPLSVGGSVSGSDTICAGTTTGVLQLTGYTGSITKWQKRLNSGTWTDISNTLNTYQEIPSPAGKWEYRAEVKSGGCSEIYSAAAVIVVSPLTVGGTAGGNATICRGSSTPLMVVSGHTGSVISWQKRINSGTWTNINHNDSTYTEVPLSAGIWDYRANVQSGACSPENSTFATITVDSASVGGMVIGSTSICIGSSTGTLNLSGSYGNITKWQKRLNSGSWADISNTSTSYSETPGQAGTWEYRAILQNGVCAEANSGIATVIVFENTVAGSVGSNTSVCLGSSTGTLTLTGNTGSITKWQKRLNSGPWTDISNTNLTYSETPLQAGTWEYRAWIKNGVCDADSSGIAMVTVDEPPVAGTVTPDTSICDGSPTGLMILNGNTGIVSKWQKRFNGGIWNDIANTNLTWSETPAQTGLWEYRAALVNGVCPMDYSAAATVTVNDIPVVALGNDTTICGNMSINLNAGNTGASYYWSDNSTGQTLLADTSGYGLGTHTFSVTVTHDGCIGFGSINVTFDACTGIFDNNGSDFVLIYPNPVSNELIIEIESNNEIINFEIYNSIGQVVYKGSLIEKTVVQTNGFTPGVYLIKLDNNKSFEFRKIIKK